jgi:lipid II:glycine glycyltransferase (peptidoglycan interpeptide bridge formation enzyme)
MRAFDIEGRALGGGSPAVFGRVTFRSAELLQAAPEWDDFVRRWGGDLVQTSIWGLSKLPLGQRSILVEARDDLGAIVGGAMIVTRRIFPGLRIGYIARGPAIAGNDIDLGQSILESVIATARRRRLAALIVQPHSLALANLLPDFGFIEGVPTVAAPATVQLDLTRSDEELLAAMSSRRRRDIRKSEREPFQIVESYDVAAFHRLLSATAARKGFAPLSLEYLNAQWSALAPSGAVKMLIAEFEGRPVAGAWLTVFGGTVTSRLVGWDADDVGKLQVNVALHWHAVRLARSIGARIYDFGGFDRDAAQTLLSGGTVSEEFRQSPHDFKLHFGPTPVVFPRAHFLLLNRFANRLARPLASKLLGGHITARLARRSRDSSGRMQSPAPGFEANR